MQTNILKNCGTYLLMYVYFGVNTSDVILLNEIVVGSIWSDRKFSFALIL